jgi:photosystem II stability/assembly factor-like uncharacterized protein
MKRGLGTAGLSYVMAGVLALVAISLLTTSSAFASVSTGDGGWVWQRGLDSLTSYSSVTFANAHAGWAVGSGGRILHTFDGGDTWYRQRTETDEDLTAIDMHDGQNGWAVGKLGTIVHTTDGGDTWAGQNSHTNDRLSDVSAVSAQEAWALGGSETRILHTTDGGATWQAESTLAGYNQWGRILFDADGLHGWITVSSASDLGLLLRTADGGKTWLPADTGCTYNVSAIASNGDGVLVAGDWNGYTARSTDWGKTWTDYPPIYRGIGSMAFASATTAWATCTNGGLMRSDDAGETWQYIRSTPWPLASVAFAGATNGWAVGASGSMIRTDATGRHWQTVAAEAPGKLWSIAFTDPTTGWAIGEDGTAVRTTDGGEHWAAAASRRPERLDSVEAIGAKAWVVGTGGSIFATADGGSTWQPQDSNTSDELSAVAFSDAQHGWVTGADGTILHTLDGGSTWDACESRTFANLKDASVVDAQTAWFVGGGTAVETTDGGASFRTVTLPDTFFTLIDFVDAEHGWVADGQGRLCSTTDGGATWTDLSFGSPRIFFQAIDFGSPTAGRAFGNGRAWTTADGGQTWTEATAAWDDTLAQPVQAVDFDGASGWAVGYNGTVLATTDGGDAWQAQASGATGAFRAVAAQHDGVVVAVGDDGLVAHSSDGGAHWAVTMMGLPENLSALSAFDASTACVAGQYGFSRTSDAGVTWSFVPQGYGGPQMAFTDTLHGWMAGYSGQLARTSDGGATWQPLTLSAGTEFIFDIDFLDSQTGWVLGLYNRLYKTTDGGDTWTPMTTDLHLANAIEFLDVDHGWALVGSSVSHTSDGGATWQKQADAPVLPPSSGRATLSAMAFADAQHGWVVGEGGTIMATTDGGTTWVVEEPGTRQWLHGVAATGPQSAWVAGENGAILHTTNGGFPAPDDAPPVTTLDVTAAAPQPALAQGSSLVTTDLLRGAGRTVTAARWYTAEPDLKLDVADATGVQVTAWAADPRSTRAGLITWQRGTTPAVSGQGLHRVCYRSVDDAGNAETVKTAWVGIDQMVPVPKAPRAAMVTRGRKAALRYLIADVAGSRQTVTIVITTLGGAHKGRVTLRQCSANKLLTYSFRCRLKRGSYRFIVSAVDPTGHRSVTPASNRLRVR